MNDDDKLHLIIDLSIAICIIIGAAIGSLITIVLLSV